MNQTHPHRHWWSWTTSGLSPGRHRWLTSCRIGNKLDLRTGCSENMRKKLYYPNTIQKKAGVAIFITDKASVRLKNITRGKEGLL